MCKGYLRSLENADGSRTTERLTVVADIAALYRAALRGAGVRTAAELERFLAERPTLGVLERGLFLDAFDGEGGVARTLDGNPISDGLLSCISSGGTLERLLTVEGRILDMGRSVRVFTPAQRRAALGPGRRPMPAGRMRPTRPSVLDPPRRAVGVGRPHRPEQRRHQVRPRTPRRPPQGLARRDRSGRHLHRRHRHRRAAHHPTTGPVTTGRTAGAAPPRRRHRRCRSTPDPPACRPCRSADRGRTSRAARRRRGAVRLPRSRSPPPGHRGSGPPRPPRHDHPRRPPPPTAPAHRLGPPARRHLRLIGRAGKPIRGRDVTSCDDMGGGGCRDGERTGGGWRRRPRAGGGAGPRGGPTDRHVGGRVPRLLPPAGGAGSHDPRRCRRRRGDRAGGLRAHPRPVGRRRRPRSIRCATCARR